MRFDIVYAETSFEGIQICASQRGTSVPLPDVVRLLGAPRSWPDSGVGELIEGAVALGTGSIALRRRHLCSSGSSADRDWSRRPERSWRWIGLSWPKSSLPQMSAYKWLGDAVVASSA